jgi:hypothetical protein
MNTKKTNGVYKTTHTTQRFQVVTLEKLAKAAAEITHVESGEKLSHDQALQVVLGELDKLREKQAHPTV